MSEAVEHKSSVLRYLIVWALLLLLTGTTYSLAQLHLGHFATPVAMAIACTKAALVLFFFMHLMQHAPANRMVLAIALVFVGLLIALTVSDLATRFDLAKPPGPWFTERPLRP